ncbi:MAG TPA: sugar phosphate isomerase/epimerase family protein [Phycisphaerae bacterium]|nr:sugar phosphate isomerase/epimerase family protein [Phycisphaerae bacterium]
MRNTRQVNYWMLGGLDGGKPIEEAFGEARKMGYDGVELTFGHGEFGPGISEARCREIRDAARRLDLKLESLATGVYWTQSLSDPRASVRSKAVAFTREYLQAAKWLGVKQVLVVPGAVDVAFMPDARVVPYAQVWKLSAESLRKCLPTARKLGVTLAIENVWNFFLTDPMAMKSFVDRFRSPRVGVYFDVGNCVINGYPEHWIEILGRRIRAVHFKSFRRSDGGGGMSGFTADLLDGDIHWKAVVAALKKIGYGGPVTAEMLPPDPEVARRTARRMKQILG